MMKKLTSFLLATTMLLTLLVMIVACDQDQTQETTASTEVQETEAITQAVTQAVTQATTDAVAGVDKEQWNTAISPANFNNVTFDIKGTFVSGYDYAAKYGTNEFAYLCKVDGDKASMNGMEMPAESVDGLKSTYINTALAIVNNFEDFTYDAESQTYKATQDITYTITVMQYDATITAKNVIVTVDENTMIATIACTMVQDFEENGTPHQYVLDITFAYSDYGTTEI